MTPEERLILQALLEDMYDQFVTAVARGRRLDPERVRALADGRVYSGRRAQELRLVDDLGGLEEATRVASDLAGIPGRPRVIRARRPFRLTQFLDWVGGHPPLGALTSTGGVPPVPLLGLGKIPLYLMD
jgi:ClpP class serine protease